MEEIHLFSEIFTIREFSHWPKELIFVPFHNTCQWCVCRIQSGELKWCCTFYFCTSYSCLSPGTGLSPLLHVLNKKGMSWLLSPWQTIFCAQMHRALLESSPTAMCGNPFFHPSKIFQACIRLKTNYSYMINQEEKWAHTHPTLEKATAPVIWQIQDPVSHSDWMLTFHTWD